MRIKYSLRQSMIVYFFLMAILPIMVVSFFLNGIIINYMVSDIQEGNQDISNFVINQTNTYFAKASDFLSIVGFVVTEGVNVHDRDVQLRLNDLLKNQNYFESIQILDENFSVINVAPYNESYIGISVNRSLEFQNMNESESGLWSSTFNSVYSNKSTISHLIPLKDGRYILGYLNLSNIREINSVIDDPSVNITILDDKGIFIADNDTSVVEQRVYNPYYHDLIDYLDNETSFVEIDYFDQKVYATLDKIEDTNWIVMSIQTDDETRAVSNDIRMVFILIFLFTLGMVIVLAILSTRQIIMPITQLNDKITEIIDGDFTTPIIYNGYNELKKLIFSFNTMIRIIKERDNNIRTLAYSDSLTGLPNRVRMNDKIDEMIKDSHVDFFGLLYMDIDNFKNINDTLGHEFGDSVIKYFSDRMSDLLTDKDFLSRYGGDEYVILFRRPTREILWNDVKQFYEKLPKSIQLSSVKLDISTSAGFSIYPDHASQSIDLLKSVDMANNYSKENGKSQLTLFSLEMLDQFTKKIQLENDLKNALKNNELILYYQPQMALENETLRGVEALIRWQHSNGSLIPPNVFIPIAEDLGLIHEIGDWVIKEATAQMKRWQIKYGNNLMISINISPVQLTNDLFVPTIISLIEKSGLSPECVELEITENILIHSMERTVKIMKALRSHGIKMSLDDFGVEYSSLNYLGELEFNVLKVDKAFIQSIQKDLRRNEILDAIIRLSHVLGLEIIAEGVETQQQLDYLKSKNCDIVQGYYFSKPLQAEQFEAKYLELKS